MSELVSIIIPVFNRAFVIREALESVLNQTYQNWEAVIVNDGSTDDTSEIVKACMRQDSRLNLIEHDRQRGAQAARNTALRIARGKWIAFLDSDDRWLPHSLEARLQLATKNNLHVVHSECWVLSPEGTGPKRFGLPRMEKQVYKELQHSTILDFWTSRFSPTRSGIRRLDLRNTTCLDLFPSQPFSTTAVTSILFLRTCVVLPRDTNRYLQSTSGLSCAS
jgi:glycosyltransferase involved in cell wall biosynthesis